MKPWRVCPMVCAIAAVVSPACATAQARHGASEAQWAEHGFTRANTDLAGASRLELPRLGDAERLLQERARDTYLLPGTNFRAPGDLPLGFTLNGLVGEVEARGNNLWNAAVTWMELIPTGAAPGSRDFDLFGYRISWILGRRDLKALLPPGMAERYQLEDAINFYTGYVTAMLGIPPEFADLAFGLFSIGSYGLGGSWLRYGGLTSIDRGDDPRGATQIRLGREYYTSGQHIHDYFASRQTGLSPGPGQQALIAELRREAWMEANRRLESRVLDNGDPETERAIANTKLQYAAIERARSSAEDSVIAMRRIAEELAREQEKRRSNEAQIFGENWFKMLAQTQEQERQRQEEIARQEAERARARELAEELRKKEEERRRAEDEAAAKKRREEDSRRIQEQERNRQEQDSQPRTTPPTSLGGGGGGSGGTIPVPGLP